MMSTEFSGNESPSQCLPNDFDTSLSSHDTDRSFYEPAFYSTSLTAFDKAFTFEGDKVFTNLSPLARPTSLSPTNKLLPNMDHGALKQLPSIGFFSKNHNNGRHDSGLSSPSSPYSSLSSPIRTPPPAFSATPMVRQTWASKHPINWTTEDTLDWVIEVAHKNGIGEETRSESFQEYEGKHLMNFTEEGFVPLTPTNYHIFYEHFNQLRKRSHFKGPEAEGPLLSSTSEGPLLSSTLDRYDSCSNGPFGFDNYNSMAEAASTTSHLADSADSGAVIQLDRFNYPVDLSDNFPEVPVTHLHHQHQQQQHQQRQPEGASDDGYSSGSERNNVITHTHRFTHPDMSMRYSSTTHAHIPSSVTDIPSPVPDDMMEDEEEYEEEHCGPIDTDPKKKPEGRTRGRKPGQTTRGNHLWEFVRDLLKDTRFSPTLIKWENRDLGIFRFVQSAQVAKMWGRRKNNLTMNYEKLSRAMRFCRDKKYFAALPEKGKYPKKLCFRFGERAFGWQTDD